VNKALSIVLLSVMLLTACGTTPPPSATEVPQAVESATTTIFPTLQPSLTNTPRPSATVVSSIVAEEVSTTSPDGKYTVTVDTKNIPFELVVFEKQTGKATRLSLTNKDLNILNELVWSQDSHFVAVTLYKDPNMPPFPESKDSMGLEEQFVLLNIPENKVVAAYDGGSHIYNWDTQNIITLEHAGLNDIFDYYFVDVDCYKQFFEYECLNSQLTGDWEFAIPTWTSEILKWGFEIANPDEIPDDQFFFVATNRKKGITWRYTKRAHTPNSYADAKEIFWDKNGENVYFAPTGYDESTYFYYGLLKMNLSTGEVIEVIPNTLKFKEKYYDLTISPSGNKVAFGFIENNKPNEQIIIIRDLYKKEERRIPFGKGNSISILPDANNIENSLPTSNIFWSLDENKIVVINAILDSTTWGDKLIANYLLVDLAENKIIPLMQNSTTYYSVYSITNETVSLLDLGAANSGFGSGKTLIFSLIDGKLLSETQTPP
jgi:hypothetical protein